MTAPNNSQQFDSAYRAPLTFWGDIRIPKEVKDFAAQHPAAKVLELGCGIGRFSQYMAEQSLTALGVDFSPVAIMKARARTVQKPLRASYLVADVTKLDLPDRPFDIAFDIGCFHCLNSEDQTAYVSGLACHMRPGATLLLWTMDAAPSGLVLLPSLVKSVFEEHFCLIKVNKSRRRFAASHWFWLERRDG